MDNNTPGESPNRQQEMKGWEQENRSLLPRKNSRWGNIGFAVAVIAGCAFVWFMKHPSGDNNKTQDKSAEQTIAESKPVGTLKEAPPAVVQPAKATPAYNADDAAQREKEQKLLEARMKSSIVPPGTDLHPSPAGQANGSSAVALAKPGEGAQDANSRFARSVSGNSIPVSKAEQLEQLDYKILRGKMIEAVLEPRAISDLPGMVCATVQRDVFGAKSRKILIPWGSRVCGTYSADIRKGQERLFMVWNEVTRPDGVIITLDSPGADQLGSSGMGGIVDNHFLEIFGSSAAIAIIGAGASNIGVNSGDQYNSSAAYRQSIAQSTAQTSQSVLQQYGSIPPTITVPAGSIVRIYVNRILDFTPVYQQEIESSKQSGVVYLP